MRCARASGGFYEAASSERIVGKQEVEVASEKPMTRIRFAFRGLENTQAGC